MLGPAIMQEYMPLVMKRVQDRSKALNDAMTEDMKELSKSATHRLQSRRSSLWNCRPGPFRRWKSGKSASGVGARSERRRIVMALLERVSTLLRANLNDLVEKAEDPERLLKQIVLDMENQLMQVKTQVAIAIADQHLLEKKRAEQEQQGTEWRRKAELAVQKGHDDLARGALERALSHDQLMQGFASQAEDQKHEADNLRQALQKLAKS